MKILNAFYLFVGASCAWGMYVLLVAYHLEGPRTPKAENTSNDWSAWMPRRTEPAVIMQVVSKSYIPVQKNFILFMEANSNFTRDNIYLVCLDEESEKAIAMMGFRCLPIFSQKGDDLEDIWKLRVKILACLLEAGHNVIMSDSDALWLKDPFQDFDRPEVRGSSIVASRGSFPEELGNVWGSTLCMGFIFFRAGMGTEAVLMYMERLVKMLEDDQKAINYAVDELGIVWENNSDMRYVPSTDFGIGTIRDLDGRSLNVTLLPHSRYTRKCDEVPIGPMTVVAHCHIGEKIGTSKVKWMKTKNLWLSDDPK